MRFLTSLLFAYVLLVSQPLWAEAVDIGYMEPTADIIDIVDAPPPPSASLSPDGRYLLSLERPALPSLLDLAEPEYRLAGIRFNPSNQAPSQPRYLSGLQLIELDSQQPKAIRGLPKNLRVLSVSWSPDSNYLAFLQLEADHTALWRVDINRGRAERWSNVRANAIRGGEMQWSADSQAVYLLAVDAKRGAEPAAPAVPAGPVVTEVRGRTAPARTYQDLLQNSHDEALFNYYMASQLVRVGLNKRIQMITGAKPYLGFSLSPDNQHLLTTRFTEPYSYAVPWFRFARTSEVLNQRGELLYTVEQQPLADNLPIAFDAVVDSRRSIQWRTDQPATLVWAQAQDGGDPRQQADARDRLYQLAAPFSGDVEALLDLSYRFASLLTADDGTSLVWERWWQDRQEKLWLLTDHEPRLLWERSSEDRYNDPGTPLTRTDANGNRVLRMDNGSVLLTGAGASDEGDRPFIDRLQLASGDTERLWRSEAPYYEYPITLRADGRLLTQRESIDTPPDFYLRDLQSGDLAAVTETPHPMPQTKGISREMIHYQREDGVPMSASLLLPAGYDAERDGPLPTIIWAYPREFRSNDAAGQVTGSPYRFNRISYWNPQFLATQGYAVLDSATMPIVGEGDKEPNDTFIEQLVMNSKAAIEAGVSRGVTDPDRVALGGHSYGAFMTANVLAHSDLFRAGIARSGAYNRSLTPFGFQREQRTLWDDTDLYIRMSPFFHAEKIKTPLLLIHGAEDNNSGTFPMQSERLYQAIKGNGGTTRLVMLPLESHGYRARESVLHMLWETVNWLDEFVKNAEPRSDD
ncbi:prolyl oligopeptidase family serine peptidase [Alkalimonas collagenimarina]|uniref:Prolyl oligopeptidase family serine peptidase n=1 Tax=Alkalimonas collagenimarina TaxID=400390 RepID=A0ABT9H3Q8_9GAMM|nr:prolyl oligopeptidase family serine peptidase [Alkalimonas collagenimarina]MDP4537928.1 prolyl oligopeptidase family serine peptidase [Alkalimonas collagenimarina]